MQGKKDYQEKLFIRFQLSDHVPQDNFYRQLKSILDLNFLYASTAGYYGDEGQKSIDPVVFMKLMLVGYLENLNSDRRIISASGMRMDILYFLGYDLDEKLPWHSTLSRTRQLFGEEQFMALFRVVLKQCVDKGLVSGKRQAVDSAFVKANASMSSMVERRIMEDAALFSKELDANIEPEDCDPVKPSGNDNKTGEGSANTAKKRTNKSHGSPSDPDARMSVKPGKAAKLNYLSQISVDTDHHVITHMQAFHADKRDGQCLPEVLENTIKNLAENSLQVREVIADGNYSSEAALQALIDNDIEGYIPNIGGYKPNREGFTYDRENDRYICSQGKYLTFRSIRTNRGNTYKLYRTSVKDCRGCPLKGTCANAKAIKSLEDSVSKEFYDQMHHRMQTPKAARLSRLRSSTVEPVLGTLINYMGMRQVNTKGLSLANKCMIMAATAYNLKKLVKQITKRLENGAVEALNKIQLDLNKHLTASDYYKSLYSTF